MPQISAAHAVARVRVLEGRLLKTEQMERMIAASSAKEAVKMMEEFGYTLSESDPSAYEEALRRAQKEVCALLRELTPDKKLTDAFLLSYDYQNAKLIRKGMLIGADVKDSVSSCGTIPPEDMLHAVTEGDYYKLPPEMASALRALNARLDANPDPFLIDRILDGAWIEAAFAHCKGDLRATAYFTTLVDLTNLRSVLRAQKASLTKEQTEKQLLKNGSIAPQKLLEYMEQADKLLRLFERKPYYAALRQAMEAYASSGDAMAIERMQDDTLLALYREKRHETVAIEPLIGYYLGKIREISMLRLIMVGKINGFKQEKLRERLRALYVG